MKCRRCWSDKAYLRTVPGWRGLLLRCLLLAPMRCHHCYEKFTVPWILTLGKQVHPPIPPNANRIGLRVVGRDCPTREDPRQSDSRPFRRAA